MVRTVLISGRLQTHQFPTIIVVLVQFSVCDVEVTRTQFLPGHELNSFREGDAWESRFPSVIGRALYWKETDLFPSGQDKSKRRSSYFTTFEELCPLPKKKKQGNQKAFTARLAPCTDFSAFLSLGG